jgi:hypothetical protein
MIAAYLSSPLFARGPSAHPYLKSLSEICLSIYTEQNLIRLCLPSLTSIRLEYGFADRHITMNAARSGPKVVETYF